MESFCKALPKIELHAHLNGSLSDVTLERLQKLQNDSGINKNSKISEFKIVQGHSRTLSQCFALFGIAHALTDTPEAVKLAASLTLEEFDTDNVVYLELRSTPRENANMTKSQYTQSMVDAVLESSERLKMKTCLIVSIDRRNDIERATQTVNVAIDMNKKYPEIIVGLDLSGDPNVGKFEDFAGIIDTARKAGLKIAIHAAEVPSEDETLEILRWKPDRLGHMTCTSPNHSGSASLWNTLLQSKIPVELALTSNVKCGSISSYSHHHFKDLYEAGHPISLATDDKGVFATNLSDEYSICADTFHLKQDQMWKLAFDSIAHIFANESTKIHLENILLDFKEAMNES